MVRYIDLYIKLSQLTVPTFKGGEGSESLPLAGYPLAVDNC